MLSFVFYLHWFLMGLVGVAGLSLIFRPNLWARLYIVAFLAQQLVLNGCIMTIWENKVKVDAGLVPNNNEFIMEHILSKSYVVGFKILFTLLIGIQLYEIYKSYALRKGLNYESN